jgi:hypothetical protein
MMAEASQFETTDSPPPCLMGMEEFVKAGYLQELNRRFLHRLGLALVVSIEEGRAPIIYIEDVRHIECGVVYGDLTEERAAEVAADIGHKLAKGDAERLFTFGFINQPIGSKFTPEILAQLVTDREQQKAAAACGVSGPPEKSTRSKAIVVDLVDTRIIRGSNPPMDGIGAALLIRAITDETRETHYAIVPRGVDKLLELADKVREARAGNVHDAHQSASLEGGVGAAASE